MCFDMKMAKKKGGEKKKKTYFNLKIPVNDCLNVWEGLKSKRSTKKITISKVSYQRSTRKKPLST